MCLIYICAVCKGKQVVNFLWRSSIKALYICIKQFWQSMYFLYFYKIWDFEFVSKYSLSTRQFNEQYFLLCREIRYEDSFIHVLFLCVFLLYHFVMFFVCIFYLFTACQVRGRFLRPPPPPLPVPSWLTHPFSLICWPLPARMEESHPACQAPQS